MHLSQCGTRYRNRNHKSTNPGNFYRCVSHNVVVLTRVGQPLAVRPALSLSRNIHASRAKLVGISTRGQYNGKSKTHPVITYMASSAKVVASKSRRKPVQAAEPSNGAGELAASAPQNLKDPELYINRELSLIDFQRRVLEEAQDASNPLLDRLMFLSFVGSNIDEFFMVRVAGLKRQIEKGVVETGPDGMTPTRTDARHSRLGDSSLSRFLRHLAARTGAGAGRRRNPHLRLRRAERRAAWHRQRLLPGHHLSHADAAGIRSRPSVPAHLESQPESGGRAARPQRASSTLRA